MQAAVKLPRAFSMRDARELLLIDQAEIIETTPA